MDLESIYSLLKLWFATWLIFRSWDLISYNARRISVLLRSGAGRDD